MGWAQFRPLRGIRSCIRPEARRTPFAPFARLIPLGCDPSGVCLEKVGLGQNASQGHAMMHIGPAMGSKFLCEMDLGQDERE
jgi:hypothetical protein